MRDPFRTPEASAQPPTPARSTIMIHNPEITKCRYNHFVKVWGALSRGSLASRRPGHPTRIKADRVSHILERLADRL